MPKNPKLMFQICQNDLFGFSMRTILLSFPRVSTPWTESLLNPRSAQGTGKDMRLDPTIICDNVTPVRSDSCSTHFSFAPAFLCLFRSRQHIVMENLVLRQQLAVPKRRHPRPKLNSSERLLWLVIRRCWSGWKHALLPLPGLLSADPLTPRY